MIRIDSIWFATEPMDIRAGTKDTPWHSRHILKAAHGGTDAAVNLEIYHLRWPAIRSSNVKEVLPGT